MKKLICILLSACMLFGMLATVAQAAPDGYSDVAEGQWFYASVAKASQLGLMHGVGDGKFAPEANLTLAETVTLAARAHSLYVKDGKTFVQGDPWYRVYADYALEKGILQKEPADWSAQATRARCAEIFVAALPSEGLTQINTVEDGAIPDVKQDAAVYTLYRAGVMTGDEQARFHPNDPIRRCEIATVVSRLLDTTLRMPVTLKKDAAASAAELYDAPADEPAPAAVTDSMNSNGEITVPYDVSHPEEFAGGEVLYEDGSMLIKFKTPFDGTVTAPLRAAGVAKLEKLMQLDGAVWYTAYLAAGTDVHAAVAAVRAMSNVITAEYNFVYAAETIADDGPISEAVLSNAQINNQWYINSVGIQAAWQYQTGSRSALFEPKMLLENPPEDGEPEDPEEPETPADPVPLSGGSSDVVVAVIDTGVDYTHEDLRANMWHNPGEIPDNGIDDDGNGYVDDYYGVDVIAGRGNGTDDHGHGTHVAGIIAAVNNDKGIVGVAYNARIMSVKAGQSSGFFTQSAIAAAVIYAANNGADVINMSFGGPSITIAVQDALAYTYTRCVLVAAAGNEGVGNDIDHIQDIPTYPAALPYVLGVMSVNRSGARSGFSNYDCIPFNNFEYELYAPGEAMLSTIPGDRYASWNGTSMAAPLVSGVAALLRSEFTDRSIYPTKFIYGQLSGTGELGPDGYHRVVNAYNALTVLPQPDVNVTDYRLFDTQGFALDTAGKNNGDGVIDAGETLAIGFFLRNHWGMGKNVTVTVDALSDAGIPCPYLEVLTASADYGTVGTYSTQDAGQIMTDEVFTGWENPIYLRVASNCPNDYIIALNVHVTAENALNPDDETDYTNTSRYYLKVRRGTVLPQIISSDMTLTKNDLYIIENATTVPEGVTLTVNPGTRIQFWTDDPHDAYADSYMASLIVNGTLRVNGSAEEPVELFPSDLMNNYQVEITGYGEIVLRHAVVTNPSMYLTLAEDCEFRLTTPGTKYYRQLSGSRVLTRYTMPYVGGKFRDCAFYKMNGDVGGTFDGCAFIDCAFDLSSQIAKNCLFYGNNLTWTADVNGTSSYTLDYSNENYIGGFAAVALDRLARDPETGKTYLVVVNSGGKSIFGDTVEKLAEYLGGTLACPETRHERDFLLAQGLSGVIGLKKDPDTGVLSWENGHPFDSEGWTILYPDRFGASNQNPIYPDNHYAFNTDGDLSGMVGNFVNYSTPSYKSEYAFLIELPSTPFVETITLPEQHITIDTEGSYTLAPVAAPAAADQHLRYFSGCEEIAAVSDAGVITPVGPGTTRIYVYSEDMCVSASLLVTVQTAVAAETIAYPAETLDLLKGDAVDFAAVVSPADSTKRPTYVSSDASVAAVDENGRITAAGVGVCTVTASVPGTELTASVQVTVAPRPLALTAAEAMVCLRPQTGLDAAETLGVTLTQDGAGEIPLVWSSSDPAVLDVNGQGELVFFTDWQEGDDLPARRWAALRASVAGSDLFAEVTVCISENANDSTAAAMGIVNGYLYALLSDGSVWYWGGSVTVPRRIQITETVEQIAVFNSRYVCILDDAHTLRAYEFSNGVLTVANSSIFGTTEDAPLVGVQKVVCGQNGGSLHILMTDGSVWGRGENDYGQLGDGTTSRKNTLVQAVTEGVGQITDIAATKQSQPSLAVLNADGEVWVVGHGIGTSFAKLAENVTGFVTFGYAFDYPAAYFGFRYADGSLGYVSYDYTGRIAVEEGDRLFYVTGPGSSGNYTRVLLRNGLLYPVTAFSYDSALQAYVPTLGDPIPGVAGVDNVFLFGGGSANSTVFICAEDGFYAYGYNNNTQIPNFSVGNQAEPGRIRFGLEQGPDTLTCEGNNLTQAEEPETGLCLGAEELVLDYDAALRVGSAYSSITLRLTSSGQAVGLRKSIVLDKLYLQPMQGFTDGEGYTLTLPVGAVKSMFNAPSAEATLSFTYHAPAGQQGAQPEPAQEPEPAESDVVDLIALGETILPEATERGTYTQAQFEASVAEFIGKGLNNRKFVNNAIINRLKDDDVTNWLRFTAVQGTQALPLGGNYWGTTNPTLIGLQIVDYRDFTQLCLVTEGEYLTEAPETVWPFATRAGVIAGGAETEVIGNEAVTFFVEFNRDMDQTKPLRVCFGSYYPYADYEVDGRWVSARRWEGSTTLTTLIEGGYQFFSIGGGASVDGKKLYTDWGRFRFEIDNSSALALVMQGSADANGVTLSWTQDDFDTLMGYNVYRSDALNGQYTRLNRTIIPADTKTFFDANVEPGVEYFYNFTVVKTDATESEPSGRISVTTYDSMAPTLTHSPVYQAFSGNSITVSANVTDNVGVQSVKLYYRVTGETGWRMAEMSHINDKYTAVITANYVTTAGVEYYIDAFDGISHALRGSAAEPFSVTVQAAVADSAKGDVNGNGRIDVLDALLILQAINGRTNLSAEQFARADINGDGELSAFEALRILQYLNGKISSVLFN